MKNKTKAMLFRLPAEILLIIIALVSLYLKMKGLFQMKWLTPITILIIVGLYFYGRYLENKEESFF
jgi:hypothetical protein